MVLWFPPLSENPTLPAAVGYELLSAGRFQFDVHGRVSAGFYEDGRVVNTAVQLGANWY